MQPPVTEDTTVSSYWLNWRVLLCSIWLLSIMAISSFIIWKYESLDKWRADEGETQQDTVQFLCNDDAWKPCLKEIHPSWLLVFRVFAFCFLLSNLIARILTSESRIFFFYTQWTFVLVTFYFGFGSLLSIYGCYQYHKIISGNLNIQPDETDSEKGNFMPLTNGENANKHEIRNVLNTQERSSPAIISYLFQVVYQIVGHLGIHRIGSLSPIRNMNAGAVMLTDCVYWLIIFPFLNFNDYKLSFMTVNMHTLNAVFLLGDTALNCLRFPWFRIAYFLLWTCVFVIFQWILHAFVSVWWPYPFLDLSSPFAPLWYLGVGLMHIPCYGIFVFVARSKHYLLSRWFPQSYLCSS